MQDHLSQTFAALADPTRRAILARLKRGKANVTELAEPFLGQMSLPAITKHVKILEKAGLLKKTHEAQRRPCELNAEGLLQATEWIDQYRVFWEESFDRLGEYLKTVTESESKLKGLTPQKTSKKRKPKKAAIRVKSNKLAQGSTTHHSKKKK